MKQEHHRLKTRIWTRRLLGSLCLAGLGCGAEHAASLEPGSSTDSSSDSSAVAGLSQELRGAAQRGGRRHHRGRHHARPPAPPPPASCAPLGSDQLFQTLNADLASVDADDQPFTRYVALVDRAAELGCGRALDGERAALSKLLNSVSTEPSLGLPVAVDAEETVYRIDLRDYDWDRRVTVGGRVFPDGWEALVASNPYAAEFTGDDADDAIADTLTSVPLVLGSALGAAAVQAPVYYGLLGIPADADDFLNAQLGVDVNDGESVRAGFRASTRAGERDFLAQRFDQQVLSGYVWQISDFGGDLFADPLGAARGERELAFTLPNGLLAHILADGNGRVKATSDVLVDGAQVDGRARIAASFLASRAQGVTVEDEVRAFVLANPGNFNAAERDAILALYPAAEDLEQLLSADRDGFVARALQQLNLDIATEPEPVSQSVNDFNAPVDAATAAAELFVSRGDLLDNLALLDPSLAALDDGTVTRDVFTAAYQSSLCILSSVLENQPARCP